MNGQFSIFEFCRRDEAYAVVAGFLRSAVIADEQLAFGAMQHAAMAGTGYVAVAFENRVFLRLFKRAQRVLAHGISNCIVRTAEEVAGIGDEVLAVMLEDERAFVPAAAGIAGRAAFPFLLGTQQQHGFADHAGEIALEFHAVDPALFQTVDVVLVAAAGIIQIEPAVIFQDVCIDDRIAGIEDGLVADIFKRAFGFVGHGCADAEIFQRAGGILLPVRAVEEIILIADFIALRRPEIGNAPASGFLAQGIAAVFPGDQITGTAYGEAGAVETGFVFGGALEIIHAVTRTHDERISRGEGESDGIKHMSHPFLPYSGGVVVYAYIVINSRKMSVFL